MGKIKFVGALCVLLASSIVKGQTKAPIYDNINMEKANEPLHKIKLALMDKETAHPSGFNRVCTLSYNNGISLAKHIDPLGLSTDIHKVKLDYLPKPNIGLLYNKLSY